MNCYRNSQLNGIAPVVIPIDSILKKAYLLAHKTAQKALRGRAVEVEICANPCAVVVLKKVSLTSIFEKYLSW